MTVALDREFTPSEDVGTSPHTMLWLCSLLVIAFFVWASVSELDIVSMTNGEVSPSSQLKTVQHLEGGIVLEILVREGERVTAGQTLVILEPTASGADVGELQVRLTALRADIARFEALIGSMETPDFPEDLIKQSPDIVAQSIQRFDAQNRRHQSDMTRQRDTIEQRRLEISEIDARIQGSRKSLKLVQEQVAISEQLMAADLTNRFVHLNLLKEAAQLSGSIQTDTQALARAKAALEEANAQLGAIQSTFQDENAGALDEARRSYDELFQRIQKFEDSLSRTTVRSPVDGVVKVLYVATIGGVIRPGDNVADIVPAGDRLIVDAQLPTQDIGYVRVGQSATVKLASSDAMRFGKLDGTVVQVSPDTLETPDGKPYYRVRIETEQAYFQHGNLRYDLYPGMQLMASIETGKRTVLQYLLDPLRGYSSSALQER